MRLSVSPKTEPPMESMQRPQRHRGWLRQYCSVLLKFRATLTKIESIVSVIISVKAIVDKLMYAHKELIVVVVLELPEDPIAGGDECTEPR